MSDAMALFARAAFVENLALSFFLGMCMFLAVSRRIETALGFGVSVLAVQTLTVPLNHLIHTRLLEKGAWAWAGYPELDLSFLGLISYIAVIAAFVQMLEMIVERFFPVLLGNVGIYLPLLTVNCAILGGTLFMVERNYTLPEAAIYGAGTGFGWALAICVLAGVREKLAYADPPAGLRGLGLSFVVVGFISLGFVAFAGMDLR